MAMPKVARRIMQVLVATIFLIVVLAFVRAAGQYASGWARDSYAGISGNAVRDKASQQNSAKENRGDEKSHGAGQGSVDQQSRVKQDREALQRIRNDAFARSGKKTMFDFCAQFTPGTEEHNLYCAPLP